jgi:hypothetical protein
MCDENEFEDLGKLLEEDLRELKAKRRPGERIAWTEGWPALVEGPKRRPRRAFCWPFWRLFGVVDSRLRRFWYRRQIGRFDEEKERWEIGWLYRTAEKLLMRGRRRGWFRRALRWPFYRFSLWYVWGGSGACPWCGDDGWGERDDSGYYETVRAGQYSTQDGTTHWWEGWRHCWRCGHVEYERDST